MCKMGRKQTTGLSKKSEESEEMIRLEERITELEKNENNRIHKKSVIAFVNEIEKAHQYFNLKDKLKRDRTIKYNSSKDDLVKKLERRAAFDMLGTKDIYYAVDAHIYDLMQQMEYEQRSAYLPKLKEWEVENWDGTITDEDVKRMERLFPCRDLGKPELLDRRAFRNPFYKLVYDVRENGRVLRLDPLVELESIVVLNPMSENVARVVGDKMYPLDRPEDVERVVRTGAVDLGEAIDKYREIIKFVKPPPFKYDKKRKACTMSDLNSDTPSMSCLSYRGG